MSYELRTMSCIAFIILLLVSPAIAEENKSRSAQDKVVARVNDAEISEAEVQRTIDNDILRGFFHRTMSSDKRRQLRKPVIDLLIERELLYQEARRLGLSIKESEIKEIFNKDRAIFKKKKDFYKTLEKQGLDEEGYKGLIEKELLIRKVLRQEVEDKAGLSEGDIEKYYNENKERFVSPGKIRLREIFIRVPPNVTSEQRREKREKAGEILRKALAGEDFAKLAIEFSEDAYKDKGGDTGYLHPDMLDGDIVKDIMRLRPNEVSGIIENIYGFFIFKMEDKEPGSQLTFNEVKDRLMKELPAENIKKIREAFINGLKARAKIEMY